MRKILLVMIFIFSLSIFTGCDNTSNIKVDDFIMLSLDISSNGQVVQSIDFSVNSKNLENNNVDNVEENQFILNLKEQVSQIRQEFLLNFSLVYIKNPNELYKINSGLLFTNVVYNSESDSVGFNMIFTSVGAWNYYHNSSQSSSSNNDTDNNLFVSKNLSQGLFPFSAKINLGEGESIYVGERYKQRYLQALEGLSFENNLSENYNPTLIYNYSTYYGRIHSDADKEFLDSNGHTHHVWLLKSSDLTGENKISIISYNVHSGWWYILALIITLIVGIILFVIFYNKKIKNLLVVIKNKLYRRKHSIDEK